jgi:hypothetical protein
MMAFEFGGRSPATPLTTAQKALICGAFALAVWGAKLWIIGRFGGQTPLSDEWDVHAVNLFAPWMDSTLSLEGLLAAQNEHRIYTTRAVALLLFAINEAWDPILEMIANAALHVTLGVWILVVLGGQFGRAGFGALALVTAVLLATPNASENPVWGLETHFYAVLLFGCIALDLLCRGPGSLARRTAGVVAATLAFLSLASGAMVFLAGAVIIGAKHCLRVESGWRGWTTAAALLACCAVALMLTPVVATHEVYRVRWAGDFVYAFEMVAGWPFRAYKPVATLVVNAPLVLLAWATVRRPPASDNLAWVLLGLGLWNGLQFAVLAFGRAGVIDSTRYLDICALNLIANFAAAALLADGPRKRRVVAAWLAAVAAGWAVQTVRHVPQELEARRALAVVQERNVRAFLTTGAFLPGANGADLPYPRAARLAEILSDPKVRRILPSPFQDAVADAPKPDRLGRVRDVLLRAGPFMAIAGALLMVLLILSPLPAAAQAAGASDRRCSGARPGASATSRRPPASETDDVNRRRSTM